MIQFKHSVDTAPVLDMAPDGSFREPPRLPGALTKIAAVAFVVAIGAGALALAALALWFALAIIPVALVAGMIAFGLFRFQLWRARGGIAARRRPY